MFYNGQKVDGFAAKCEKCGSDDVNLEYEFNYYGGATGYDQTLTLICMACGNKNALVI